MTLSIPLSRPALVLDPFLGSGTTAVAAVLLGRDFVGVDLREAYVKIAEKRIALARERGVVRPPKRRKGGLPLLDLAAREG